MRLRDIGAAIGLLLLAVLPAAARGGIAGTFETWGLMGTWAADCAVPPGRDNTFYTFVRRTEGVFLERDGGSFKDTSPILETRVRPDGMIEYRVAFGEGRMRIVQVNTYAKRADGRIRIFFNRRVGGDVTVEDGRLLPSGEETAWRERCSAARSVGIAVPRG